MAEINAANITGLELISTVRQDTPGLPMEGDETTLRLNRDYGLQVNSRDALVDQWTRQGRVFIANNPVLGTPETMSATGTAITLTAPSIRYTVPAGHVVVPISAQITSITVNAKKAVFAVIVNNADSYTSGGDAVRATAKNALVGTTEKRGSAVTKLHYSDTAIVEAGLTSPRLLKFLKKAGTATDETTWNPEYNILKGDPMVYIVGPASFLVFDVQETAADEAEFCLTWAELDAVVTV
jgi:hypothetical protein